MLSLRYDSRGAALSTGVSVGVIALAEDCVVLLLGVFLKRSISGGYNQPRSLKMWQLCDWCRALRQTSQRQFLMGLVFMPMNAPLKLVPMTSS